MPTNAKTACGRITMCILSVFVTILSTPLLSEMFCEWRGSFEWHFEFPIHPKMLTRQNSSWTNYIMITNGVFLTVLCRDFRETHTQRDVLWMKRLFWMTCQWIPNTKVTPKMLTINAKAARGRISIHTKGVFSTVNVTILGRPMPSEMVCDNNLSAFQIFLKENREAIQSRGCDKQICTMIFRCVNRTLVVVIGKQ